MFRGEEVGCRIVQAEGQATCSERGLAAGRITRFRSHTAFDPWRSQPHLGSLTRGSVFGDRSQAAPRVAKVTVLLRLAEIGLSHTQYYIFDQWKGANSGKSRPKVGGELGQYYAPERSDWTSPARGHAHEAPGRHLASSARVVLILSLFRGQLTLLFCPTVSALVSSGKPLPLSSRLKFLLLPINCCPQLTDNYEFYTCM